MLQPEDVGLTRGPRRRTDGLRREEVAALSSMSPDYYARLEQGRGPQPSTQMLGAIARGLRLTLEERDHLLRLAGHVPPPHARRTDHVDPALLRVLDRLDTPAAVISDLNETLAQNALAVGLLGDGLAFRGLERSFTYRWFTHPPTRDRYPVEDHPRHTQTWVADLRAVLARDPEDARARELVAALQAESRDFREAWSAHEVARARPLRKRIVHPAVGTLELDCQVLAADDLTQLLLVFTATPGSEDADKLRLLAVIGDQELGAAVG